MPRLLHGDCLDLMAGIDAASVDMILCDLPYGTTACKWDSVIPFEPLWAQYKRIAKPNAAIVLTASQPFTTALIGSNMKDFRYCWVWDKAQPTGFLNANRRPLGVHEDVCVFASAATVYNAQKSGGHPQRKRTASRGKTTAVYGDFAQVGKDSGTNRFPTTIISISKGQSPNNRPLHPTQKPVALMEYLIRTYTNEGETVLDNCMGSGTTGVACANTGREFIGIEKDAAYFEIARQRILSISPTLL
jgi:DNA modification methylase